jgi:hypothetical protein
MARKTLATELREVAQSEAFGTNLRSRLKRLASTLEDAEVSTVMELQTRLCWARLWRDEKLAPKDPKITPCWCPKHNDGRRAGTRWDCPLHKNDAKN